MPYWRDLQTMELLMRQTLLTPSVYRLEKLLAVASELSPLALEGRLSADHIRAGLAAIAYASRLEKHIPEILTKLEGGWK